MMAAPLVEYLNRPKDSIITIGNEYVDMAKKIADTDPVHIRAAYLDIDDTNQLESLIAENDHVISFIPPPLHPIIARACLKVGRNMTTSSYNNPEIVAMEADVKAKDLIFLNECGLDPGIDIMGTMKVVHEETAKGNKIVSYESYCGGLPVPEQADDNPFGYKFSWNPGAAIKTSKNPATYRSGSEVVTSPEPLKVTEIRDDFSGSMKLETYPNRDSLSFEKTFGMNDCRKFVRGTIRFEGFSTIISAYHDLGLSSENAVAAEVNTLKKVLQTRIVFTDPQKMNGEGTAVGNLIAKTASSYPGSDANGLAALFTSILERVDFAHIMRETSEADKAEGKMDKHDERAVSKAMHSILKSLDFLEFFTDGAVKVDGKKTYLQLLSELMQGKLNLGDHDRDLVVMRHEFGIQSGTTGKEWRKTSTMVASGNSKASGGFSIMGQTVGFTCAIATRLVLEKKFPQRGVLSPIYPEIYNPILEELEAKCGVKMREEDC